MAPIEPGDSGWPARKERLLERVHARGQALHRRAQIIRGLSVATVLLLLAAVPGAFAASGGGGQKSLHTIAGPSTSTSEETSRTSEETTTSPASTTSIAGAKPTIPRTPSTSLVCRNSYDARCGPFRWDPPPGQNEPLSVTVTYSPAEPKTGETVTFHVVVDDRDAHIDRECNIQWNFGDPTNHIECLGPHSDCAPDARGPWVPPAKTPDHYETDFQHVYASAGKYTASFRFVSHSSRPCGASDPYGSQGSGSVTVTVASSP